MDQINPMEIYSFIRQGYEQGRARGKQSRLAQLASQAYGADPEAQRGLVQQAIGVDPQAGFQLGQSLGNDRDQLHAQLAQEAGIFADAPDDQKASMYPQLAAHAKRLGFPVPDAYDPRMLPMIQKIAMAGVGTSQTVQSTYIDAQGNRVAILRNGQTQVLGQNAPNVYVRDQPGVPFDMLNKSNGQSIYAQQQMGAQFAPSDPNDAAIASINAGLTQQGLPPMTPQQEQQVRSSMANGTEFSVGANGVTTGQAPSDSAPVPQQSPASLPPPLGYQNGGTRPPTRPSISPAEQQRLDFAAQASRRADEASKRAAEIASRGTAPAGQRFRADGSLEDIPGARQPAAATGAETQKQAVYAKNMAEDALAFAASFTGIPIEQLRSMTPEQVRTAMMSHDRMTAGPVIGSIPGMGKFANADLEAYSNSAAGKQARINNPTGPVTNADFEVARKSVFSSDKPRKVNADLIYEALVRAQKAAMKPSAAIPQQPAGNGDFSHLWGGQ